MLRQLQIGNKFGIYVSNECRCYILWMGKIGKTVNYINPAIDYGAKEPRAESIIPSN